MREGEYFICSTLYYRVKCFSVTYVRIQLIAVVIASLSPQVVLGVIVQVAILVCNHSEREVAFLQSEFYFPHMQSREPRCCDFNIRAGMPARNISSADAISVGISNLIISKREGKWIGRPTAVHPAGAIACTGRRFTHTRGPRPIRGLSYYPRIKTQIKRGRPKLN